MAAPVTTQIMQNDNLPPLSEIGFSNPSGLNFAAWNTERDGSGQTYLDGQQIVEDVNPLTLYAQWGWLVTWNSQGGSAVNPQVMQDGQELGTLPTTTKSGFNLLGWYTATSGGTKAETTTLVTENVTYYARWDGVTYTKTDPNWIYTTEDHPDSTSPDLFTNIPKGTYNLTFNKIGIFHDGSTISHDIKVLIRAENSATAKTNIRYLPMTASKSLAIYIYTPSIERLKTITI